MDLESDISDFQWCISTENSSCDVVTMSNAYRETNIRPHNLSLPVNTHLFVKVVAHNHVGLVTEVSSKQFIVDTSPPYVAESTVHMTPSSLKPRTQYDSSYISL